MGKTSPKLFLKSYLKQPPNGPIYRAPKTSRYGPDRAVGRPPTVRFLTVGAAVDRPGRPRPGYREQTLCPVDRPGRPGLSREQSSLDGRPALLPELACTSVHVSRPPGRSTSELGRPVGRPLKPENRKFRD